MTIFPTGYTDKGSADSTDKVWASDGATNFNLTVDEIGTEVFVDRSTTNLVEGTNEYYTEAKVTANTTVVALGNDKSDKTNVLELDNTTSFTPSADFEPATKKYVDDQDALGAGLAFVGDGIDGAVTISSNTTLTSNKYYDTLVIDNTFTLNTGGYRVYAKTSITNNGTIANNGSAGGNGTTGGAVGTAGVAAPGVTVPANANGAVGGVINANSAGSPGAAGTAKTACLNTNNGVGGGAGGASIDTSGGAGGAGGASTDKIQPVQDVVTGHGMIDLGSSSYAQYAVSGSAGGGGGAGDQTSGGGTNGGTGGGGGGMGGFTWLSSPTIDNTSGTIEASGGVGGNGGNGTSDSGGGGGGGGGNGGVVVLLGNTITVGTTDVTAGAGGTGGTASAGGTAGTNGTSGSVGSVLQLLF